MLFFIALVLLPSILVSLSSTTENCRDVTSLFLNNVPQHKSADLLRSAAYFRAKSHRLPPKEISTSLSVGFCLYFTLAHTLIKLTLTSLHEIYPIVSRYNFSLPDISTSCWCDCPAGRDYCNSGMTVCSPPCVTFYAPQQTTEGCSNTYGDSQMCCTSQLTPGDTMTALKLGTPSFVVTVKVKKWTEGRKDVEQRTEKFSISSDEASLLTLLRPAWYVTYKSKLYSVSNVNELEEWDVEKLGWFRNNGIFNSVLLTSKLSGNTSNCHLQNMTFHVGAVYSASNFPGKSPDLSEYLGEYILRDAELIIKNRSGLLSILLSSDGAVNIVGLRNLVKRDLPGYRSMEVMISDRFNDFSTADTLSSWTILLNPQEWLNGVDSSMEAVLVVAELFSVVAALIFLVKFFKKVRLFYVIMCVEELPDAFETKD